MDVSLQSTLQDTQHSCSSWFCNFCHFPVTASLPVAIFWDTITFLILRLQQLLMLLFCSALVLNASNYVQHKKYEKLFANPDIDSFQSITDPLFSPKATSFHEYFMDTLPDCASVLKWICLQGKRWRVISELQLICLPFYLWSVFLYELCIPCIQCS